MAQQISTQEWAPFVAPISNRIDQAGKTMVDMADWTGVPYYTVYQTLGRLTPTRLPALVAMAAAVGLQISLTDPATGEILASLPFSPVA